jgi:hypothetical protein
MECPFLFQKNQLLKALTGKDLKAYWKRRFNKNKIKTLSK